MKSPQFRKHFVKLAALNLGKSKEYRWSAGRKTMKIKAVVLRDLFFAWLLLASTTVAAMEHFSLDAIVADYSGSWYVAEEPGWGVIINVLEESRTAGWLFIYDEEGDPLWFELQGDNFGSSIIGPLYYHSGLRYSQLKEDQPRETKEAGTWNIQFFGCDTALFDMQPQVPDLIDSSASITKELTRLTYVHSLTCEDFAEEAVGDWAFTFNGDPDLWDATVHPSGVFIMSEENEQEPFDECVWQGRITFDDWLETGSAPERLLRLNMSEEYCDEERAVTAEGFLNVNEEVCLGDETPCDVYDEVLNFVDHSGTEYIFMRNSLQ
jgi:hypothetical protein